MSSSNAHKNSQYAHESQDQFGCNLDTTTGLTFGYYSGVVLNSETGTTTVTSTGTKTLTASNVNWIVYRNSTGSVVLIDGNDASWDNVSSKQDYDIPLWKITTDSSSITSRTDYRSYTQYPKLSILPAATQLGTATLTAGNRTLKFFSTQNVTADTTITSATAGNFTIASQYNVTVTGIDITLTASDDVAITATDQMTLNTADLNISASDDITITANDTFTITSTTNDITLSTPSLKYVSVTQSPPSADNSKKIATTEWVQTEFAGSHPVQIALRYAIETSAVSTALQSSSYSTATYAGATYVGTARWGAGVLAQNGCIYYGPASAGTILKLDPQSNTAEEIDISVLGLSNLSHLTGVLGADGVLYFIPFVQESAGVFHVIKYDPITEAKTTLIINTTATAAPWFGGVMSMAGNIYLIPYSSTNIVKIDTVLNSATIIPSGTPGGYIGGVLGLDGKIYCMPYTATTVLIIDPTTDTVSTNTYGLSLVDSNKWAGGVLGSNGKIYGIPFNSTSVLIINTTAQTATRNAGGPGAAATLAMSSKWFGGCNGPDGYIYCAPYDNRRVLVINTKTETLGITNDIYSTDTSKYIGMVQAPNGVIYGGAYSVNPAGAPNFLTIENRVTPALDTRLLLSPYINKF